MKREKRPYLVAISVLELNIDLVGRTDHEGNLPYVPLSARCPPKGRRRYVGERLTFCSALPTPMTKTFPPKAID